VVERIISKGAVFAAIEDAAEAVIRIAVDKSIHGEYDFTGQVCIHVSHSPRAFEKLISSRGAAFSVPLSKY
jgi:hypothetical protein